jgi:membrane protein DedA with SNARE-associated domain
MDNVLNWVMQYKYLGIYGMQMLGILGLPIPDDSTLVFYGYLAHQGKLDFGWAWLAACLGSLSGITISYLIGRTLGYYLLEKHGARFGVTHEKIGRVHAWFQRVGKWGLAIGYFIPGIRHLNGFAAGLSELEFPVFALFAYPGGVVWTLLFMLLGNFLGEGWSRIPGAHRRVVLIAAAAVVVLAAAVYFILRRRKSARSSG